MRLTTLLTRNLSFHWRSNLAVLLGVVVGTAVLTGALLVGDSLRGSMRQLTLQRLGKIDAVVVTDRFFRADLADRVKKASGAYVVAPAIVLRGSVFRSNERLGTAQVVGVDERFWPLFGVEATGLEGELWPNEALARGTVAVGDQLEIRLEKPQTMPSDSLLGRPTEDPGITLEASAVGRILANDGPGAFSLDVMQQRPKIIYVQLRRLQQRLRDAAGLSGAANALFIQLPPTGTGAQVQEALNQEAELEDLGLRLLPDASGQRYLALESRRMLIEPEMVAAAQELSDENGWRYEPTLTYLANKIAVGDKFVPYSTVTGLTTTADPPWGPLLLASNQPAPALREAPALKDDEIVLNDWAARDLGLNEETATGATVKLTYFVEDDGWLLKEETATFKVAGIVAITGAANDRTLTPELPGMRATSIRDWTPPFPKEQWHPEWVKERDEQYWRRYRATPKAFVNPATAQRLWKSKYGEYTSLRFARADGQDPTTLETSIRKGLKQKLPPERMGLKVQDVKNKGLAAAGSSTAQMFGFLFVSFSFFLIVSAALLVGLLFRLGVEQRAQEIGVLFASGFRQRTVRWLLLAEGVAVAIVGGLLGLALAVAYAWALLYVLRGFWQSSPLQVNFLKLHVASVDPAFGPLPYPSLVIGFLLSLIIALGTIYWSTRVLGRLSPRALLGGQVVEDAVSAPRQWTTVATVALLVLALVLAGSSFAVSQAVAAPLFFGSGASLLLAGIGLAGWWLRDTRTQAVRGHGTPALLRLGAYNSQRNRGRSLLTAGLIASATFLIVAVESFRKDASAALLGTGGFSLLAESDVPLYQPPNTPELRKALWADATPDELAKLNQQLEDVTFHGFRLRPGDDVSCLNLYQPQQPRVLGVPRSLANRGGFTFGPLLEPSAEEKANPWLLLDRPGNVVPIIADDHTAQWVLQKKVGDQWELTDERGQAVTVQLVALLHGSIFQSELLMGEEPRFRQLFPSRGGYPFLLIDTPANRVAEVTQVLEKGLGGKYGLTVTSTVDRLAQYHSVENTYLSTFQLLGGLGLLLGTLGLAVVLLRNVWERRGELALLRALGYRQRDVGWLVFAENGFLVILGLVIGVVAAIVAVLPHVVGQSGRLPWMGMGVLVLLVFATGMVAGLLAVRSTLRLPLLGALRRE